ncbi:MAG TPA: type II toxin-antitoxin system ParD family antitoxin [Thermomicrobiales bacterium]|jgi:putative addiction module CopG family antidote
MSVTLTPRTEAEIRRWLETGRYADADAVVHTALAALEAQEQEKHQRLRALVLAGHNSGPGEESTDELWEEIAREADEADRLGLPIRREVQP